MVANDKPMLAHMLKTIVAEAGLGRGRILDTNGRVWLSSAPEEVGIRLEQSSPNCRACHPAAAVERADAVIPTSKIADQTLYNLNRISNQPECYSCHGSEARTLGLLVFETPLTELQGQLVPSFLQIVLTAFILMALFVGLLMPTLSKLVIQPVVLLAQRAKEIGAGNLEFSSPVQSDDEVGDLARAFDSMRRQLKAALVEKERRNRELETLNELARATSQLLDPQQILNLTIDIAVSSLGVQAGAIYLLDRERDRFSLHACKGIPECRERACQLWGFNRHLAGLARPDHRGDSESADTCYGMWQDAAKHSYVGVPLKAKGMLLGAMTFMTHPGQEVTGEAARVLRAMGEEIGLALASALHFQDVRYQATIEERERLAREMHDSLAQALGYLKLQAAVTDDLLSNGQIVRAQANLKEVKEIAKETYVNVREAIFGLRHLAARQSDFLPALEEYLAEYRTHYGLDVELNVRNACPPSFPPQVSIQLTRIIQEALTNVRKHAQVNRASICIEQVDQHWQIEIRDNGQGFDLRRVPKLGKDSVGLNVMRERANEIGAKLKLESCPGSGTAVILSIPVTQESQNAADYAYSSGR